MEEITGLVNATGAPMEQVLGVTLLPEIIKAACSMFGAFGKATEMSRDGALVQLRALDWTTNGPFQVCVALCPLVVTPGVPPAAPDRRRVTCLVQQFPEVLVYHPNEGNGHAYAVLTWSGFVGAITGYSSAEVGVCEKVWLNYKGKSSRAGIPFTFLLRDILQYDTTGTLRRPSCAPQASPHCTTASRV